jgi:hypothetical protein
VWLHSPVSIAYASIPFDSLDFAQMKPGLGMQSSVIRNWIYGYRGSGGEPVDFGLKVGRIDDSMLLTLFWAKYLGIQTLVAIRTHRTMGRLSKGRMRPALATYTPKQCSGYTKTITKGRVEVYILAPELASE